MPYEFEQDDAKADANFAKHGVTFAEAQEVFDDPLAYIFPDDAHSEEEPRAIAFGHAASGKLLVVIFTERVDIVRLISARSATRREKRNYENNSNPG